MSTQNDLTRPPPHRGPTKLERLMPHLPRIEEAKRLGWRMTEIQEALSAELDLGDLTPASFRKATATARRRAAAAAKDATTELGAAVVEPVQVCDLTKPPNREATKLARLIPHLPRIEEARRLGWRIPEIQETLAEELGLEAMSNAAFRVLLATAQRRVAAQSAAPVEPIEDAQPYDLTAPPPGREPHKLARLIPHLPRIDEAMRMGWRLSEIQKSLAAELGVGSLSESAFRTMVSTARRRVAA